MPAVDIQHQTGGVGVGHQEQNRIGGNINGLMGGMELQIPDAQTVAARSPEEATALVDQQHQAWRDRNKPQPAAPTRGAVSRRR